LSEVTTKVAQRSSQRGDYELYGGEASPGIDSLQLIVRAISVACHVPVRAEIVCDY